MITVRDKEPYMRRPRLPWSPILLLGALVVLLAVAGIQVLHITTNFNSEGISSLASAAAAVLSSTVAWLALRHQAKTKDTPPPRAEPADYIGCFRAALTRLERTRKLTLSDHEYLSEFSHQLLFMARMPWPAELPKETQFKLDLWMNRPLNDPLALEYALRLLSSTCEEIDTISLRSKPPRPRRRNRLRKQYTHLLIQEIGALRAAHPEIDEKLIGGPARSATIGKLLNAVSRSVDPEWPIYAPRLSS
ncbi:hypothetical protein ABZ912_05225 [Nonomuraea angiospora]|uniref:hypothetical protein n=1 Tax=Nonomuraea angiospora TaxID=46172 RepID=UPI0034015B16